MPTDNLMYNYGAEEASLSLSQKITYHRGKYKKKSVGTPGGDNKGECRIDTQGSVNKWRIIIIK